MKRRSQEAIEFPANPFIVLCDFVIVLLLVVVLALLQQTMSGSRLIERLAVAELQTILNTNSISLEKSTAKTMPLVQAYQNNHFRQTHADGDLQRFWFDGACFYQNGLAKISPTDGKPLLAAFGSILAGYQGDAQHPDQGLFKYIIVEGHADRSEGDDVSWELSLERAREAAKVLQDAGVNPVLIEISGRGCWVNHTNYSDTNKGKSPAEQAKLEPDVAAANRRVEIVVAYTGRLAPDYLKTYLDKQAHSAVSPGPTGGN